MTMLRERVRAPIVTRHFLAFRDADGRLTLFLTPKNSVTLSGRARVAALAFAASTQPFGVVALSADQATVSPSSTGIGTEVVARQATTITVSGTLVELSVTFTAAEVSAFTASNPIRRLGLRSADGQFLFVVPITDTVPPAGNSMTYVAQIDF